MLCLRPTTRYKICLPDDFPEEIKKIIISHIFKAPILSYKHRLVCKEWRYRFPLAWTNARSQKMYGFYSDDHYSMPMFHIPISTGMDVNGRVRDNGGVMPLDKHHFNRIVKNPTSFACWLPIIDDLDPLNIVVVQGYQANDKMGYAWYIRIGNGVKKSELISNILRCLPFEVCERIMARIFTKPELKGMRRSELITKWQPTENNRPVTASLNGWDKNEFGGGA